MKKIITQNGEVIMNNNMPWSCLNISPDSCCKGDLVMCESIHYLCAEKCMYVEMSNLIGHLVEYPILCSAKDADI